MTIPADTTLPPMTEAKLDALHKDVLQCLTYRTGTDEQNEAIVALTDITDLARQALRARTPAPPPDADDATRLAGNEVTKDDPMRAAIIDSHGHWIGGDTSVTIHPSEAIGFANADELFKFLDDFSPEVRRVLRIVPHPDDDALATTRAALDGTEMMLWVLSEILDRDESALPFRRLVDAKRKQVSAALADAARAGGKAEGRR